MLFDEVVTRFGQGIQTQRLSRVYVDDDDFSSIFFEMSNCSKYMIGHDKSLSLSDDRPEPSDIIKDIEKVNGFIKKVNARKVQLGKARKQLVEKLPKAQVME